MVIMSRRMPLGRLNDAFAWSAVLALGMVAGHASRVASWGQEPKVESPVRESKPERLPEPLAKPASEVHDAAGLFGAGAVTAAERRLRAIERETQVATRIETIATLKGELIDEMAARLARQSGVHGIFVLIARKESKIEVLVSRRFSDALSRTRLDVIRSAFIEAFRRQEFNEGLQRGVNAIQEAVGAASRAGELPKVAPASPVVEVERSAPPRAAQLTDSSPLVLRNRARLTLAGARAVIAAALAKAQTMELKVNIAVVDDGGHLLAFERMDGARPASGYTAITKATTAATFRQATGPLPAGATEPDVLLNLSLQNAAQASGGKITSLHGGIPVQVEGDVIGGVGVGGGTGEQDAEIARAGVQALSDRLGQLPSTSKPTGPSGTPIGERPR
jgi:glc operon protein GlcG